MNQYKHTGKSIDLNILANNTTWSRRDESKTPWRTIE